MGRSEPSSFLVGLASRFGRSVERDEGHQVIDQFAAYFGANFESAKQYVDILLDRGIEWGLLGPREGERLWERHILNSVAAADLLPFEATVIDVGSGAGLPGLPLALLRPDLTVTLLEPMERRVKFLDLVVAELELGDRVRVVRDRAESHSERYQVVTSRALAPLPKLLGWCAPLVSREGRILALKGSSAEQEVLDARAALGELDLMAQARELEVPVISGITWVVEASRARQRRAGLAPAR